MKVIFVFLSTILLMSHANARSVTIPIRFIGEFNSSPNYCGTDLSDMRVRISATKIKFYESEGNVKAILSQPNGEITVMAEYSGEGKIWTNMIQLATSRDGKQLIIRNPSDAQIDQQSATRIRCSRK